MKLHGQTSEVRSVFVVAEVGDIDTVCLQISVLLLKQPVDI